MEPATILFPPDPGRERDQHDEEGDQQPHQLPGEGHEPAVPAAVRLFFFAIVAVSYAGF